ncbi:MAG: UvrD-helicase domain-containing protein [Pirellulales bacterium]
MNEKMAENRINATEADERNYLEHVKGRITSELDAVNRRIRTRHAEMQDLQKYLQENKADMDHAEKASTRQSVNTMTTIGEEALGQRTRLAKLLSSPYFGRIDVDAPDAEETRPTYIGIHSLYDGDTETQLVHDWRAPIASMFYEFELGDAHYDAPEGRIECQLLLKRQYRIEDRELKFMLESSLNIQDDVLQEELSRASDDKMKNIVATIQRDQNAIIRNDQAHTLIIQGAAGSGKTSIALHRIAFLLYKYRDSVRSDEILIVSPNKVFAHYISQVLPELGEEMIQETTMEQLASELVDHKIKFQSFAEQVSDLLNCRDERLGQRVAFKSTPEFLRKLDEYGRRVTGSQINAADLQIGLITIEAKWIEDQFRRSTKRTANEQVTSVLNAIVEHMRDSHRKDVVGEDRTRLRAELKRMIANTTLKTLYKEFYAWLGEPQMFKLSRGGTYEYSDIFPLIYLKIMLDGVPAIRRAKHVVIDEMQDYTPVQYEVIGRLFSCKKTILGDHNQSVSPLSSSSAEAIQRTLPGSECMYMHKSYRSTLQITRLAQSIQHNADLVPIERHGVMPSVVACTDFEQEVEEVRRAVREFQESDHNSLGIICKTQDQANKLYDSMADLHEAVRLLDSDSTVFSGGGMVVTAFLAKGLEFDQVILPFCSDKQYHAIIDRHMLYVGCTRAMHRLCITYSHTPSRFLKEALDQSVVDHHRADVA